MLPDIALQFAPLTPTWIVVVVAGVILFAIVAGTAIMLRRRAGLKWAGGLAVLRLGAWALFVLMLLQPSMATTASVAPLAELLVLVDTSRSMAQPAAGANTRLDAVRDALEHGELASALNDRFRLHWFGFDHSAVRVDHGDLKRLLADGSSTHFANSLRSAYSLLQAEGKPPHRALLASDGKDHGGADIVDLAHHLGVTIDVLAPASNTKDNPATFAVADVQAARRVLLGSETHFRVTLEVNPPTAESQELLLHFGEDGKELQAIPVTLRAGEGQQVVMLAHRPTATGTKIYDFRLGRGTGQASPAKKVAVQVVDSKYEVLILEDAWRWEYKFLHRLFEDDPSFRFTALLPRGKRSFVQFASPDRRVSLIGFPQGAAELEGFDLFFLGDVQATRWPSGVAEAIAHLVADEGKSLVVIAGPRIGSLVDVPALHAILPVVLTRESGTPIAGGVEVRPRPDAAGGPLFFQLAKETSVLPPLDNVYPVLRKRSGAAVLLEAPKHRNDYGPLIVMAEHTVGRGRVLFIGTDTLWKWHTLAASGSGPTPYTIFWQQAVRALTPQRSQLGAAQLWLTASRSAGTVDQPLEIEAEIQSSKPLRAAQVHATLVAPGGDRWPIALNMDPANPLHSRARFTPASAGTYHVQAVLNLEGKIVAEAGIPIEIEEARDELHDTRVDEVNLRRIASATGGKWIDPSNAQTWPRPEPEARELVPQARTFDLWGSFTLLLLLCAILGIDWTIRVVKGFV